MRVNPQKVLAVLCLVAGSLVALPAHAQNVPGEFDANQAETNPGEIVRLEDQLQNGLRTFTPEQRQYVSQVVALVEQGRLPRAMVNVVYTWALKRNPSVPLPYFQVALRALAERRGIAVP
ncbi:MAG: hypothetical protein ACTHK7_18500 [Aureliella sp.]